MSIRSHGMTMISAHIWLRRICNMLFGIPGWKFEFMLFFPFLLSHWNPRQPCGFLPIKTLRKGPRTRGLKFSLITSKLGFNVEIYPRIYDKNYDCDDISGKPAEEALVPEWPGWQVAHISLSSIGVTWIYIGQRCYQYWEQDQETKGPITIRI